MALAASSPTRGSPFSSSTPDSPRLERLLRPCFSLCTCSKEGFAWELVRPRLPSKTGTVSRGDPNVSYRLPCCAIRSGSALDRTSPQRGCPVIVVNCVCP